MQRVTLDSSVLVSAFLKPGGYSGKTFQIASGRKFQLILSSHIIGEVRAALETRRLVSKYSITDWDREVFLALLLERSAQVQPVPGVRICRDPSDDVILATAIAGSSDYLVTRDDDIKIDMRVTNFMAEKGVKVVTVRRFNEIFGRRPNQGGTKPKAGR